MSAPVSGLRTARPPYCSSDNSLTFAILEEMIPTNMTPVLAETTQGRNWKLETKIYRQNELKENFAFTSKGVLFIGLNLVGGLVHDSSEWRERHISNANWIETHFDRNKKDVWAAVIIAQANPSEKHLDFMSKFLISAEQFSKPIIFIHGDGHRWIYEESWLKPNIIRIQVDKGGIAPPLKLIMNPESKNIISYDREQY